MKGDFILSTRAQFIGKGVEAHRKIGWMVRSTLDSDSTHVNAAVHGDVLHLYSSGREGGPTEEARSAVKGADVIQLERKGDSYTMVGGAIGDAFVTQRYRI